ncbi:hypothetical protein [Alteromonas macleodii]|uniref:hypothetical protein n=1 Tax=Alteromonas macleodii TaxID=28108 RepID=UPI00066C4F25|nr:hypothetical protein [Alteromonas macleodii]CAI3962989.1 hypothetical protein MIT1002_02607 [Alteromonas macleodii]VTP53783.1 hypothetical protein MIT1002_02607 [Alteromonas macleodii]
MKKIILFLLLFYTNAPQAEIYFCEFWKYPYKTIYVTPAFYFPGNFNEKFEEYYVSLKPLGKGYNYKDAQSRTGHVSFISAFLGRDFTDEELYDRWDGNNNLRSPTVSCKPNSNELKAQMERKKLISGYKSASGKRVIALDVLPIEHPLFKGAKKI